LRTTRKPSAVSCTFSITSTRAAADSVSASKRRLRKECLNEHVLTSLDDARSKIEQWRIEYNREQPHASLGYLTPEEFAAKNQESSAIARTAWPADQELAGALQRRAGLGSKN
jgi:transposase InsO family protein